MDSSGRSWLLGMSLVLAVALIWVAASFLVQFVEGQGVPAFLFTYICNSLFVVLLPVVELSRCTKRYVHSWRLRKAEFAKEQGSPRTPARQDSAQSERQGSVFKFELWRRLSFGSNADDENSPLVGEHQNALLKDRNAARQEVLDGSDFKKTWSFGLHQHSPSASINLTTPDRRLPVTPEAGELLWTKHDAPAGLGTDLGAASERLRLDSSPSISSTIPLDIQRAVYRGHSSPRPGGLSDVGSEDSMSEVDFSDHWSPRRPRRPRKARGERFRAAAVGLTIAPLWFLAQYTFNLSLHYTSVTSNTILSSTSSLFTFLLSVLWLGEAFSWFKLGMVVLCMLGTSLVSLADFFKVSVAPRAPSSTPLIRTLEGDVLCIVSAVFYATYTAALRRNMPSKEERESFKKEPRDEKELSTAMVLGFVGLFGALLLWPLLLLLHFTGLERIHGITQEQSMMVVSKGLLDNVLSDYLWARAVLLTTPTAATAGLSIQVPIAIVADFLVKGVVPGPMLLVGGGLVLFGFIGINQPAIGCGGKVELDRLAREPLRGMEETSGESRTPLQRVVIEGRPN